MKRIFALTIILASLSLNLFAKSYEETMAENITKIYQSKTPLELVELANQFERIANVEKEKWMPGYYAAYCFTRATVVAEIDEDKKEEYLNLAQEEIDKIEKINSRESEIYALQAFIYQLRINGAASGYKYSKLSNEAIAVAEKLNPENPRVYYLKGTNTFHTPKMFGGGKENAKPYLQKAAEMFATGKVENALAPTWGSYHCNELLKACDETN